MIVISTYYYCHYLSILQTSLLHSLSTFIHAICGVRRKGWIFWQQ